MCDGDDHDALRRTVDLVDHAEVTSTSAVQTAHFEPKGFANSVRVLGKSAIDELDAGSRGLLWKSIEGPQGACGPIDVVHVERLPLTDPSHHLLTGELSNAPRLGILATFANGRHERGVTQNLQRLLE